ncbi:unnamed protein product [Closterium sp. NIES-54]
MSTRSTVTCRSRCITWCRHAHAVAPPGGSGEGREGSDQTAAVEGIGKVCSWKKRQGLWYAGKKRQGLWYAGKKRQGLWYAGKKRQGLWSPGRGLDRSALTTPSGIGSFTTATRSAATSRATAFATSSGADPAAGPEAVHRWDGVGEWRVEVGIPAVEGGGGHTCSGGWRWAYLQWRVEVGIPAVETEVGMEAGREARGAEEQPEKEEGTEMPDSPAGAGDGDSADGAGRRSKGSWAGRGAWGKGGAASDLPPSEIASNAHQQSGVEGQLALGVFGEEEEGGCSAGTRTPKMHHQQRPLLLMLSCQRQRQRSSPVLALPARPSAAARDCWPVYEYHIEALPLPRLHPRQKRQLLSTPLLPLLPLPPPALPVLLFPFPTPPNFLPFIPTIITTITIIITSSIITILLLLIVLLRWCLFRRAGSLSPP